ncbi:MAG: LysR substrate-binding domain-containing protein, partial [Oscillospiraceae bacterium]
LEKNTSTRRHVDEFLAQWGQKLEPEFELATANLIAQFALRNLGVGCIVRNFAQPMLDSGELFELKLQKPLPARKLCIAKNKKSTVSVAAQKLIDMIF